MSENEVLEEVEESEEIQDDEALDEELWSQDEEAEGDSESEGTLWLAPNVGPVKMVSKSIGGEDEPEVYHLVEYDIKVESDRIGVSQNGKLTALWARMKK